MNKIIDLKQLFQLVSAHLKETIREPGVLFWGIIFPILMSLGLGIAFTQKPDVERNIAIIKQNYSSDTNLFPGSKLDSLIQNQSEKQILTKTAPGQYIITIKDEKLGNTTFHFQLMDLPQAMVLLKRGNINMILSENQDQINYQFDPLNPDAQLNYLKLNRLFGGTNPELIQNSNQITPLVLPGTRYIDFLVPGLMAMGVMMSCMWGISYNIIDKRAKKLLRRMVATPMKKNHFLIALITVRIGMNFLESVLLFLFAWLAFDISIQGNSLALITIFIAGNIAFAGLAVFISSHTANTEIGNGFINAVVMPMMVLSGIFFSYHNFPDWSIPVIQKMPLTMLADGMRTIFIEGGGFVSVILPVTVLIAIGGFFFTAGLKLFKWY